MLRRRIQKALHCLPERLILRFGRSFSMDGLKVVIPFQERSRVNLLHNKMVAALRLIRSHTPKSYARIQTFIPNLLILGAHPPYYATYIAELRLCDISTEFALSDGTGSEQMAMTLIHEATHGYLQSRGIAYSEQRRAQIERICVQAEIAFARKLPGADALVTEAQQRLDYGANYWSDESFYQRDVDELTRLRMPKFLIRRLKRLKSGD